MKTALKECEMLSQFPHMCDCDCIEVIPEVVELAKTTHLRYKDVLAICEGYGYGYKKVIQKHMKAGTMDRAFEEIAAGRKEIITNEELQELNRLDAWEKERKLPKKYMKGWN